MTFEHQVKNAIETALFHLKGTETQAEVARAIYVAVVPFFIGVESSDEGLDGSQIDILKLAHGEGT